MNLYKEYVTTKQAHEGFLEWLLIRKMTFRQQSVVIFLLITSWLIAAPYLVFWVNFFKGAIVLSFLLLLFNTVKKINKYLKECRK